VALGHLSLSSNTHGNNNTAIGNLALLNSVNTSEHVAVGREAGLLITDVDNNIIIGHHTGAHSVFGQVSGRCFIDNIYRSPVSAATALMVYVDSDGRLGTCSMDSDPGGSPCPGLDRAGYSPQSPQPQAIPDAAKQAVLDLKVQNLRATVTQQQQQIEMLTAQLKENTAQIQKANAQLEMNKPAAKVVVNEPKALP
jgi:hypothetical protein